MPFVLLAAIGPVLTNAAERALVGTWSNQKEGFAIITFGLRADGSGFFAPSMSEMTTLLRWKATADGAELQIAAPPHNPVLHLSRTDNPDELLLKRQNLEPEKFIRVSTVEPPDLQKAADERRAAEDKKLKESRISESHDAPTIAALKRIIRDFTTAATALQSANITGSSGRSVSLNKTNRRISIQVRYSYAGATKLEPGSVFSYTTNRLNTELKPETLLPEVKQRELEQWLTDIAIKHETAFYKADGTWGIQAYYRFCSAYIDDNPQLVFETVQFILDHIVYEEIPYRVSISKHKGA